MILLIYNLALLVALAATAPFWLWKMATSDKYRDAARRLGRPDLSIAPGSAASPLIWLHAVSVGEVLAVSRLVNELDVAFPRHRVVISTTTRTGQQLARQRFGAERVFYSPLDLPWAVRAWLEALRPSLLILAETEFWPNLLAGCFRRGIPVAVVNARISDRSYPRYLRLRRFWRPFLSRLAVVLAQTPLDADRLRAIGCKGGVVSVAGNLKFDVRAPELADATRLLQPMVEQARILVAGSTLEGEEAALLEIWPALVAADPQLVMVLAPRHPERFPAVAALLQQSGIRWHRRSTMAPEVASLLHPGEVLLLDSIGELASVYSLASVAFIGGSLVSAGGHNPLEPAQFGVAIAMGPSYENFRAIVEDLLAHQAIRIANRTQLSTALGQMLRDRADSGGMGERAREVFESQAGATQRCLQAIVGILSAAGEAGRGDLQ